MKRTEKINIQGIVFNIDEDAYHQLKTYLKELEIYFRSEHDTDEVYIDIELRLVELLQEKINASKQVITSSDVTSVIERLGKIGDFSKDPNTEEERSYRRRARRLYRDPEKSYIGGVCSGVGAYFGIDTIWVRLLFLLAVLLNGFGVLAYLIMWVVVPKARTTAQRLEMNGDEVNINNIENTIKEEYGRVRDNFGNWQRTESYQKTRDGFQQFFSGLGAFFGAIFRFLAAIIGISIVITAVFALLGISFFGAYQLFDIHYFDWDVYLNLESILSFIMPMGLIQPVILAVWLMISIPVVSILYLGLKMLFRFKINDRAIGALLFGTFILAMLFVISVVALQYPNYDDEMVVTETTNLSINKKDTLYLTINDNLYYSESVVLFDEELALDLSKENRTIYIEPEIDIEKSENGKAQLIIRKKSRGEDQYDAKDNIDGITYEMSLEGSEVKLDKFFRLQTGSYYRGQELDVVLQLPEGTTVVIPWQAGELLQWWSSDLEKKDDHIYVVD